MESRVVDRPVARIGAAAFAVPAAVAALLYVLSPRPVADDISSSAVAASPAPSPTTDVPAAARKVAFEVARSHLNTPADASEPMVAEVVRTSYRAALEVMDSSLDDVSGEVWAFQFAGDFNAGRAPAGMAFPTGSYMFVTVDARSGQVRNFILGDVRSDIESLGAVEKVTG